MLHAHNRTARAPQRARVWQGRDGPPAVFCADDYCVAAHAFTRSPCAAIHVSAAASGFSPFWIASITLSISPGFH